MTRKSVEASIKEKETKGVEARGTLEINYRKQ